VTIGLLSSCTQKSSPSAASADAPPGHTAPSPSPAPREGPPPFVILPEATLHDLVGLPGGDALAAVGDQDKFGDWSTSLVQLGRDGSVAWRRGLPGRAQVHLAVDASRRVLVAHAGA